MKEIICKLIGHKTDKDYNDSGYLICKRCQSHEYYDDWTTKDVIGIIRFPFWRLKLKIRHKIYIWKCDRKGLPF